ncbi:TadE/TadG family type IV pilus assembly protein [Janibacter sp. G349]|uniref:TadE/TadG family type IV pilus assembly protein n=1 Tax=unclassified Janibacter TaxID=2649294 RepID=UPI003B7B150B
MRAPSGLRTARDRGAAAVEMAIVLPLLLLVLGGIIDFGRYFLAEVQLTNAVREGARVMVISEDSAETIQRVQTAAPAVAGLVTTTPGVCPGTDAKVRATAPFDWIILKPAMSLVPGGAANSLPTEVKAEAVMRCGG